MINTSNYVTSNALTAINSIAKRQHPVVETSSTSEKIIISSEARQKSISPQYGSKEYNKKIEFLMANDEKFAEIREKQNKGIGISSSEMDYMEKANGLPNTMAFLNSKEKGLYDKLVSDGNTKVAAGIYAIAHIRAGGLIGAENTLDYDPNHTSITPKNINDFFSRSITSKSESNKDQFNALVDYLNKNPQIL